MSGAFSGVNTAGVQANGATLVISNTSNTSTASLAIGGSTPPIISGTTSPTVSGIFSGVLSNYSTQTAGATNTVQFNALTSGQSVTVAGLTYTAGVGGATAAAIATAFANIANGNGSQLPNMTGNLTGVTTAGAQANNGSLVFSNTSINALKVSNSCFIFAKLAARYVDANETTYIPYDGKLGFTEEFMKILSNVYLNKDGLHVIFSKELPSKKALRY
jgi:hypothetical protein